MQSQEHIFNSPYNPYRFIESGKNTEEFLKQHKLPLIWTERELKLSWAFQGLLGTPLNSFDEKLEYAVFENPSNFSINGKTLLEAVIIHDELHFSELNERAENHYTIALVGSKTCSLSNSERKTLIRFGIFMELKSFAYNVVLINLQKALDLLGNANSSNFRILVRMTKQTDLFSTLCEAFEIPNSEDLYYKGNERRNVFDNPGELIEKAEKRLSFWVEDNALRTHLACFLEQRRGAKRRGIFLSSHFNTDWNNSVYKRNEFPGFYLQALASIGATCLLGWEWEASDVVESRVLVEIKKK